MQCCYVSNFSSEKKRWGLLPVLFPWRPGMNSTACLCSGQAPRGLYPITTAPSSHAIPSITELRQGKYQVTGEPTYQPSFQEKLTQIWTYRATVALLDSPGPMLQEEPWCSCEEHCMRSLQRTWIRSQLSHLTVMLVQSPNLLGWSGGAHCI